MNTVQDLFLHAVKSDSTPLCFYHSKEKIIKTSYHQFFIEGLKVAGGLQEFGATKQDRVGLIMPTSEEYITTFFGIQLSGAIPCSLYPPLRFGKIDEWIKSTHQLLATLRPKILVVDPRVYKILAIPLKILSSKIKLKTYDQLINANVEGRIHKVEKQDLAFIQFSSGSTGRPKPVAITNENAISNTEAIEKAFSPIENKATVSWLPLYHDMGLVGSFLASLRGPTKLTLIRPEHFIARPYLWIEAMSFQKATITVAPNFAYGYTAKKVSKSFLQEINLSHWQVALCGAEPIQKNTFKTFVETFSQAGFREEALTPVYGLAEATLAVTFTDLKTPPQFVAFDGDALEEKNLAQECSKASKLTILSSLGTPVDHVEVEVRDKSGDKLEEGKVGRVFVRGKGVMQGYLFHPSETAQSLKDGWLDTGDRGFVYKKELFLYGRFKDIIVCRGRNYDPSTIEEHLNGIDGVRPGCIVAMGIPDEKEGTEQLVIVYETSVKETHNLYTINELIKKRVLKSCHLNPQSVIPINPGDIPRTSSGKIRRNETKKLFLSDKLGEKISHIRKISRGLKNLWEAGRSLDV